MHDGTVSQWRQPDVYIQATSMKHEACGENRMMTNLLMGDGETTLTPQPHNSHFPSPQTVITTIIFEWKHNAIWSCFERFMFQFKNLNETWKIAVLLFSFSLSQWGVTWYITLTLTTWPLPLEDVTIMLWSQTRTIDIKSGASRVLLFLEKSLNMTLGLWLRGITLDGFVMPGCTQTVWST